MATDRNHRSDPLDEWADRDYPVAEDMAFQRLSWIIERSGWAVMVVLVIVALAGAFSSGFISGATTSDPSGALTVEYERFHRTGASDVMQITAAPLSGDGILLHLDAGFLRRFTIESVTPEPREWRGDEDGAAMVFPAPEGRSLTVHLALRPERAGRATSRIMLGRPADHGPAVELAMFVYP